LVDEVYDFLTFDHREHVRFAAIGDNWERTITVYSGGKLFNATGWKVGWALAHPRILRLGGIINSTLSYCVNHPAQVAMSRALPLAEVEDLEGPGTPSYVNQLRSNFETVRDYLTQEIKEQDLPWTPLPCESGYFMLADVSKCRDLIPDRFFKSHSYEIGDPFPIPKHELYIPGT